MRTLGEFLSGARKRRSLSLRAVEAQTKISNAYLSQLENNRIQQPSPIILEKLSQVYGVPYLESLRLAGYPVPEDLSTPRIVARLGETTREEEDALAEYLDFLRAKRSAAKR